MSVETEPTVLTPVITEQIGLTDEQVTAEVEVFLSTVQTARPPYYGGLKYTAAWWAEHNARHRR